MSIFSSFRRAREHNAKLAEQKKKDIGQQQQHQPYRHVPTHAASDAFASAPPSWREAADRLKIAEQNRRRSAMTANGVPLNVPGVPRIGSSLSFVSYPGSPMRASKQPVPRSYSYTGMPSYPHGSRDLIYSIPDVATSSQPSVPRDGQRDSTGGSTRLSLTISKERGPPSEPCSDSISSQDGIEMKPSQPSAKKPPSETSQKTHRLHPSNRSRRSSDPSRYQGAAPGMSERQAYHSHSPSRDSRPPPSTRGFSSIPTVQQSPLREVVGPPPNPSYDRPPEFQLPISTKPVKPAANDNWAISLPDLSPTNSEGYSSSTSASPVVTSFPARTSSLGGFYPDNNIVPVAIANPSPSTAQPPKSVDRRTFKSRFNELEPIRSQGEEPSTGYSHMKLSPSEHPMARVEVVNFLPEPAAEPFGQAETASRKKGKRLSKGGGKLLKKNRG